ncbi:hypothetical protein AB0A05_08490 [Streptomyces sp. NPDC046374]|uniref:hypothetical protein n=1 Tax=Streptomyces sp. NPDC046374 TaxID=3154917 RepID=UPI0033EED878
MGAELPAAAEAGAGVGAGLTASGAAVAGRPGEEPASVAAVVERSGGAVRPVLASTVGAPEGDCAFGEPGVRGAAGAD